MSRPACCSRFLLLTITAGAALACSGDKSPVEPPPAPAVAAVHVTPAVELEVGQSRLLEMYVEYVGDPAWIVVPAQWSSRDTSLVKVDSAGLLSAGPKIGSTYVIGTAFSRTDSVQVVIKNSGFYIWPDTALLRPGLSRSFRVQGYSSADGLKIGSASEWTSSDPTVASVDAGGVVMPLRPGHATIIARDGDRQATAEAFVAAFDHPLAFQESATGNDLACARESTGLVFCWGALRVGPTPGGVLDRCEAITLTHLSPTVWLRFQSRCAGTPVLISGTIRLASLISGNSFDQRPYGLDASGALYAATATGLGRIAEGYMFRSVSIAFHTCGITTNGGAVCWGTNSSGELGVGLAQSLGPWPATPQPITGGLTWTALVAREHGTCGLTVDGQAFCWGDNRNFRLGVGPDSTIQRECFGPCVTAPRAVQTSARFTSIAARTGDACGIATDGLVYCWGIFPTRSSMSDSLAGTAIAVAGAPQFVSLQSGLTQLCGVTADGSAYCLARNESATTLGSIYSFVRLPLPFPVSTLSVNAATSCAKSAVNGLLYCWGDGTKGTLGDGQFGTATSDHPVEVAGQR